MFEKFFNKAKEKAKEFVDQTVQEKGENLGDLIEIGIFLGAIGLGSGLFKRKHTPVYILLEDLDEVEDDE